MQLRLHSGFLECIMERLVKTINNCWGHFSGTEKAIPDAHIDIGEFFVFRECWYIRSKWRALLLSKAIPDELTGLYVLQRARQRNDCYIHITAENLE